MSLSVNQKGTPPVPGNLKSFAGAQVLGSSINSAIARAPASIIFSPFVHMTENGLAGNPVRSNAIKGEKMISHA